MASTETLIEYLLDKGDIDSLIHVGGHHGVNQYLINRILIR